jgi:hypothetical protein
MQISKAVFLLLLIGIAGGCGSSPTAPAPLQQPPPQQTVLANFADPSSSFSTSDVRDVQDHIVNFDISTNSLVWSLTGQKFTGYPVNGNFIGSNNKFQVRFGTKGGDCRAYFTEAATGTICDIELFSGQIVISPTQTTPEGSCKG